MSILEFIKEHGLVVEELIMDGTIHRVPVEGGRPGSKDGSYCFYDDEKGIAGWIQNYRTGVYATHGEGRRTNKLSHPVKLASNINNSRQALYDKAAETARYLVTEIFKPAPASNHYLARKRISAHGSLIDKAGILIIPLKNINGNIRTFQRILDNGEKYFLKGATADRMLS